MAKKAGRRAGLSALTVVVVAFAYFRGRGDAFADAQRGKVQTFEPHWIFGGKSRYGGWR